MLMILGLRLMSNSWRELSLSTPLGSALSSSHLLISITLKFWFGRLSSGKETRLGQLRIYIWSRLLSFCRALGTDWSFLQFPIKTNKRAVLSWKLPAIDWSCGQSAMLRYWRASGNFPVDDKAVSSSQFWTSRCLIATGNWPPGDDKLLSFRQVWIFRRLRTADNWPLGDRHMRDWHPEISKLSRTDKLVLLIFSPCITEEDDEEAEESSPSSTKHCNFSQFLISRFVRMKVAGV